MSNRSMSRGFSLIEMMIASAISLVIITGAITAGVYLQRRGILEERTMTTQNTGRATRDLLAPAVQRAGAGFGSAPVYLGNAAADLRYAVQPVTNADFLSDTNFAVPSGLYAGMRSDALELYEADFIRAVRLDRCNGGTSPDDVRQGSNADGPLCLTLPAPPDTDGGLPATTPVVVADPTVRGACVGVVGAGRTSAPNTLTWTLGAPGATAFPSTSPCTGMNPSVPPVFTHPGTTGDLLLMPLSARAFRVNWKSGQPVLEMDPDGALGNQGYQPLSNEIERLQVRLGVINPDNPAAGLVYFPDPAAIPARPAVDQCTNATCWTRIPGDAGTMGASDFGLASARDELMRRVRVVELSITARSERPDTQSIVDGGVDDEGNPLDGYKRRHFLIRVTPRNFGIAGG